MYEIHELAGIVPLASEREQLALTEDIAANGQNDSIKLWNEKIVDGRCRQLACIALDIEPKVERLDPNMSYAEVRKLVKSWNTRRNLTNTQKVVSAHYDYIAGYGTLDEVAKSWAISRMTLANVNFIAKHRPEIVKPLFDGSSVTLVNRAGVEITTNRINTIAKLIKDSMDSARVVDRQFEVDVKYSVEELPLSSQMYDWFNVKLGEYNRLTEQGKEAMMKAMLFELARYKEINAGQIEVM